MYFLKPRQTVALRFCRREQLGIPHDVFYIDIRVNIFKDRSHTWCIGIRVQNKTQAVQCLVVVHSVPVRLHFSINFGRYFCRFKTLKVTTPFVDGEVSEQAVGRKKRAQKLVSDLRQYYRLVDCDIVAIPYRKYTSRLDCRRRSYISSS